MTMTIKDFTGKKRIGILILIVLIITVLYFVLSVFVIKADPLTPLRFLYDSYLNIVVFVTNTIFSISNADVTIVDHRIIFDNITEYVKANDEIITNWPDYILFKKWSVLILLLIWLVPGSIQSKLKYSVFLLVTHFFSVVSGLLLIALIGPAIANPDPLSQLYPNIIGELFLITLLIIWFKNNNQKIQTLLSKIKINLKIPTRKLNEIIVIVYVFSLLDNFIIPFFSFSSYINFLLIITKFSVFQIGYDSTINGPYLIGNGGTLFMAKWCLGFLTMFVFASLIYLTRGETKAKWLFIFLGLVFLHIVNVVRLAMLFIFVQNNDSQLAENHHNIYNVVFYIIIFILWIIWFEKFALKKNKEKSV